MSLFTDSKGDEWLLEINCNQIDKVRSTLGIDLATVIDKKSNVLKLLAEDVVLLCNTLFLLCEKQAEHREVSDEEFGTRLVGDALENATNALLEGIADFFPSLRRRILKDLQKKSKAVTQIAETRVMDFLEKMTPEKIIEQLLQQPEPSSETLSEFSK